jgi:hypothetical protein
MITTTDLYNKVLKTISEYTKEPNFTIYITIDDKGLVNYSISYTLSGGKLNFNFLHTSRFNNIDEMLRQFEITLHISHSTPNDLSRKDNIILDNNEQL